MIIELDEHQCLTFRTEQGHFSFFMKIEEIDELYGILREFFGNVHSV